MAESKKARILYLLNILQEETHERHPLTIPQIIAELVGYGIHAGRRTGVGKTTTTVNLGVGLAMLGNKVLHVDADA